MSIVHKKIVSPKKNVRQFFNKNKKIPATISVQNSRLLRYAHTDKFLSESHCEERRRRGNLKLKRVSIKKLNLRCWTTLTRNND